MNNCHLAAVSVALLFGSKSCTLHGNVYGCMDRRTSCLGSRGGALQAGQLASSVHDQAVTFTLYDRDVQFLAGHKQWPGTRTLRNKHKFYAIKLAQKTETHIQMLKKNKYRNRTHAELCFSWLADKIILFGRYCIKSCEMLRKWVELK